MIYREELLLNRQNTKSKIEDALFRLNYTLLEGVIMLLWVTQTGREELISMSKTNRFFFKLLCDKLSWALTDNYVVLQEPLLYLWARFASIPAVAGCNRDIDTYRFMRY